jgi:carbonic anhydrase
LHHVKEVVLSSLQENDAVGVDKKFKSTEEEKKYHFDILERAKAFLQSNFPDLSIRVVYAENQGVAVTFDELGTTDDPYQIDMPEALPEKHDHTKLNACCMDGRLRLANDAYMLEKLGEKDFDVLNFPGIAMILAGDQPGRELFIDAIDRAIRTRGIDEFVLSSHQDCGAAGGSKKFGSREAEKEYHTSILDRARSYLQQRFPDLKVQVVYLEFAGDQVTFNKVASEESEAVSESVA